MPRKGRTAGKKKQQAAVPANEADVAVAGMAAEAGSILWDEMKRMGFAPEGTEVPLSIDTIPRRNQIELGVGLR